MQPTSIETIPTVLKQRAQWIGFRLRNGKKIPCIADSPTTKACCNQERTWRSFAVAARGLQQRLYDAVAYALNGDFIGVDLDDCIDNRGATADYAAEIIRRCESYTETSFSGDGIHILLEGSLPGGKGRKFTSPPLEVYGKGRFFIVTGNHHAESPADILNNDEAVRWILNADVTENAETNGDVTESAETTEDISSAVSAVSAVSVTFSTNELINLTLPKKEGERNAKLFDLARGLRHNLKMGDDLQALRPIVRRWWEQALPFIRTKGFDETWADFVHSYPLARHRLGDDPLLSAWEPVSFPPSVGQV